MAQTPRLTPLPLLNSCLASLLASSMVFTSVPLPAQTLSNSPPKPQSAPRPQYKSTQLTGDERILHALNRFTFGPKPGDLEAVKAVGLDRWFQQQLHPETIDQSGLTARLEEYPAMDLSPQDLIFRYPTNGMIRQTIDRKVQEPQSVALRKIYDNEIFRYDQRQQEKQQQKQLVAASTTPPMAGPGSAPAMGSPAAKDPAPLANSEGSMDGNMSAASPSAMSAPSAMANSDQNMAATASSASNATSQSFLKKKGQAPIDRAAVDPALVDAIAALPPDQRISRLANMPEPDVDTFLKGLKPAQRFAIAAGLTPLQKEYLIALVAPQRVVNEEIAEQRLTRDIYSNTQLLEVMTDFWLNHFNVYLHKNDETPAYLVSFERDVIRPRALGKFEDLLEATAHSPAMLLYLDNSSSMGPDSPAAEKAKFNAAQHPNAKKQSPEGLNENYARELMELHTLGVNGGYTQADVTQVARILTGWTVEQPQRGGGFKFEPNRHEPGTKKVMGKKFKENGDAEGRELLHMLASNPATARFLSRKLAIRFVGDNPPQALVDRMAKSYSSSGGDISKVLTTLYRSPEFWTADTYRNKVKTPIEFIASAARASNLSALSMEPLVNALRDMGMPLYGAVPPTGYKWEASTWVSTGALVNRMNFALLLAANKLNGITVTWTSPADSSLAVESAPAPLPPAAPTRTVQPGTSQATGVLVANAPSAATIAALTPESEEQRLESQLVAGGLSDDTRKALLDQFNQQAQPNPGAAQDAQPQSAQPQNVQSQFAQRNPQRDPILRPAAQQSPAPRSPAPNQNAQKQPVNALEKQDQLLAGLLLGSPEFQRR
jgi:uncharacterized protein (DUF1800 family)